MLTLITTLEPGELDDKPTTQRTNYPFNSFFKMGGDCFGLSDDGFYELGGDDDDGTDIDATFEVGMSTLGIDDPKKLRYLYTFGQLEGNMSVTATPDDHTANAQTQTISTPDSTGTHRIITKMGEGVQGTFWRFSFSNVDGAFFSIHHLKLLPIDTNQGYEKY